MAAFVSITSCHVCSNTSRHKGVNTDFLSTFDTPGSSGKHKPLQFCSRSNSTTLRTPGKEKMPTQTPRSSISSNSSESSSSSSKSSSKPKNRVVQRLSKILMREDNQSSKKGCSTDLPSSP